MEPSEIKKLPATRALLYADGYTDEQIGKPFVGIVYSSNEITPGHKREHIDRLVRYVAKGIELGGGTAVDLSSGLGVCDGIAMGHEGMKSSLASRDINFNATETIIHAHSWKSFGQDIQLRLIHSVE